ncbi:hypothetical protein [Bosea sp. NBC_00550]|nr:hypothetical protein [Bosea sp. NBC_00550]UZF95870.1 hypothetical protein NWE53_28280 [Bosea sp. NBC_00550]
MADLKIVVGWLLSSRKTMAKAAVGKAGVSSAAVAQLLGKPL